MITLALAIAAVFILGILYARADYAWWEDWLGLTGRAYAIDAPHHTDVEDDGGEGMACYDDGSGCRPCKSDRECREGRGPRPVRFRPTQQVSVTICASLSRKLPPSLGTTISAGQFGAGSTSRPTVLTST